MRHRLLLLLTLVGAAVMVHGSAGAASPRLSGPTTMTVLQKVTFKATGLRPGRYALFIAKSVQRGGHSYRCVAFLSGERPVSASSERFYGSVPDGVGCRRGGAAVDVPIPLGRYRLYACRPTPAAYCSSRASTVSKAVRIRR
jgi:hypothetical protein